MLAHHAQRASVSCVVMAKPFCFFVFVVFAKSRNALSDSPARYSTLEQCTRSGATSKCVVGCCVLSCDAHYTSFFIWPFVCVAFLIITIFMLISHRIRKDNADRPLLQFVRLFEGELAQSR